MFVYTSKRARHWRSLISTTELYVTGLLEYPKKVPPQFVPTEMASFMGPCVRGADH